MCEAMEKACLKARKELLDTLDKIRKLLYAGKSPDELLTMGYNPKFVAYVVDNNAKSKAEIRTAIEEISDLFDEGISEEEVRRMGYTQADINTVKKIKNR
jgi:hypothetical protein